MKTAQTKFDICLHYYLQDCNHYIDAKTHNEAERHLINSILELNRYLGGGVNVNVGPKEPGGLLDIFEVIISDPTVKDVLIILLTTIFNNFFRPRPKKHKLEDIELRMDIVQKIKDGNITEDEAKALINGDKKLKQWISNYYKTIKKETRVTEISADIQSNNSTLLKEPLSIKRNEFDTQIIEEEETTETRTIEGETIYIVSPILVKGNKDRWKGVYSSQTIEFKMDDDEFLKQVYNKEIKFGNGTCIKCTLRVTTKTKYIDNDPDKPVITKSYVVSNITQWEDDKNFQYETKRYKRTVFQRNHPQLSINFDNEDNDKIND